MKVEWFSLFSDPRLRSLRTYLALFMMLALNKSQNLIHISWSKIENSNVNMGYFQHKVSQTVKHNFNTKYIMENPLVLFDNSRQLTTIRTSRRPKHRWTHKLE